MGIRLVPFTVMKTVILDTNFLVECAANKIDIHSELRKALDENFEVAILDKTMDELDTVIHKGGKTRDSAKLAKTILMTKHVSTIMTEGGHADKLLLNRAGEDTIIATQDKELKQKLKKKKQPVIVIRQKKKLALMKA